MSYSSPLVFPTDSALFGRLLEDSLHGAQLLDVADGRGGAVGVHVRDLEKVGSQRVGWRAIWVGLGGLGSCHN